jgi:hypothetical protein
MQVTAHNKQHAQPVGAHERVAFLQALQVTHASQASKQKPLLLLLAEAHLLAPQPQTHHQQLE